ncbi:MAG: hypothetical protein JJ992_04045, partial [Planctomycetes bacterium]|nr:hypothetical protein [Planctomycetota bacterium]
LSEPQIARMTTAFRKHQLDGARIASHTIEIPRAEKEAYLMALDEENAWPARFDDPVDRALAGANPLMPWQQSRESLERGEKQMLARIVEEMNGIENAAVQYDEIRQPGFPPRIEVRAVVAVKAVGRRPLELEEIEAIRDTVVAFKSGLERENVTITDLNACRAYPGGRSPDTGQAAARAVAAAKDAIEDELRAKIAQRLSMYPGLAVAVNAHFDERPAADLLAGSDGTDSRHAARLVRVTASIDVPRSYFVTVWRHRYGATPQQTPPPDQVEYVQREICGTIERAVSAMLPPPAPGWQTSRLVTVTSHDELPPEPVGGNSVAGLPTWMGAALAGLTLITIVVLPGGLYIRRRRQSGRMPPVEPRDAKPVAAFENLQPRSINLHDRPPVADLKEQLNDLIKRDPGAAAEVLRQWLSRAA